MAVTTDARSPELEHQSFAPAPPPSTFSPPPTWIDPDQSKGWIRRLLPVLRPHRSVLIGSMVTVGILALRPALKPALRPATEVRHAGLHHRGRHEPGDLQRSLPWSTSVSAMTAR
jgi:hypothetical protein